jgi:hypothetical protein
MKWFDSLFSDKQSHTSLHGGDEVEKNMSHKSYRDIRKRKPIISLTQGIFDAKKSYTPFSFRRKIHSFCEQCETYVPTLTRRHWIVIIIVIVLAYLIYGLGFLLRTEAHMETLRDAPGILMTPEGLATLRNMREDYQVIAPII